MRKEQLLELVRNSGFDAMILTSEVNRRYATGFHSTSGAVYLSEKQAVFLTDSRYYEAASDLIKGFDVRKLQTSDSYSRLVNALIMEDNIEWVALEDKTLTYSDYMEWTEAFDIDMIQGLGDAIDQLREVKDSSEVQKIVSAQRIAEKAYNEILNEIKPGVSEKEIAARLTYLMLHYGAENMSFDPIVVSGKNSSKPHGVPSEKLIESGDFVTMDFGCIFDGYCSDMTRTVAVGSATDEMKNVYETVLKAQEAGIKECRAGLLGKELDAAARKVITDAGYGEAFGHGFGHGVGLEIHEAPSVGQKGETKLRAGCIVTAEPGIYLEGKFGVRIEDMLHVTENGSENLTKAPKDLIIL